MYPNRILGQGTAARAGAKAELPIQAQVPKLSSNPRSAEMSPWPADHGWLPPGLGGGGFAGTPPGDSRAEVRTEWQPPSEAPKLSSGWLER